MSCVRNLASWPSDRRVTRFTGRDHRIEASPISNPSSLARSGGMPGGALPSILGLKHRERTVFGAREAQFRVGQPKGRQVELRAVLEHLKAIDEAVGTVGLRRKAGSLPRAACRCAISRVARSALNLNTKPQTDEAQASHKL